MNKCEPTHRYYDRSRRNPKSRASQQLRELEGRERLERSRVERRLHLTTVQGAYQLPPFHSSEDPKCTAAALQGGAPPAPHFPAGSTVDWWSA